MIPCATCGDLAERVDADLEAGEALPPGASRLEVIEGSVRQCPTCRAWFRYTYDYEYGALGDGWEDATLERIDPDEVIRLLRATRPSPAAVRALEQLGVANGEAAITQQLVADLDDPAVSDAAVGAHAR